MKRFDFCYTKNALSETPYFLSRKVFVLCLYHIQLAVEDNL